MAPHSSTLAWKIPWTEEPGRLQTMEGREESDTTERLHFRFSLLCIGEGNGNPLQCSCLENPRDGGAWWAAVYGVAQSRTRLKRLSSSSRVTASEIYKEPGQYHKWAHELGLQEQGVTGTVANRRTCLLCLKAAGYPSMWKGRPSIARPIHFARDVRNGSTLCWPDEACWMGWIWPEEWSCSWWQKWLPRSVGWT